MTTAVGSGVKVDIEMLEGAEDTIRCTVKDASGTAVDLTGATGTWYFRDAPNTSTTLNLSKSITLVNAVSGIVSVSMATADTTGKASGTTVAEYYHELVITLGGVDRPVVYGRFSLRPSVL